MEMHEQLQQAIDEINGKMIAKGIGNGAKKVGHYLKDSAGKASQTAQNAIVAGIAAPVGIKTADKLYNRKPAKKERTYTQAEVATLLAATKKNESLTERLHTHLELLEAKVKRESGFKKVVKGAGAGAAGGAAVGGGMGASMLGGAANVATRLLGRSKPARVIRNVATGAGAVIGGTYGAATGALKGAAVGGIGAGVKHAIDKNKAKKKSTNESLLQRLQEAGEKLDKKALDAAKKVAGNPKLSSKANQAKRALQGSPAVKKALRSAQIEGGLKGAVITAGLGAAAYGIQKYRNRNEY